MKHQKTWLLLPVLLLCCALLLPLLVTGASDSDEPEF